MCVCVLCVCLCYEKWSVGGEKLYRQRRSGGSAPIEFDQSRLPWWLGIRPITSDVIGATCAKTMQWQSKDNAKAVFLHLIVWFHQEWIGLFDSIKSELVDPMYFLTVVDIGRESSSWLSACENVLQCKTMSIPAGWVHVKNRRHHQNTKHQSSPMSYTPDMILILDCKKRTTNVAISSGNKSCELARWNDFIIDIHLIHGSVQMFKSFEFKLLINFSHLRRFPLSNNYPPE